MTSKRLRKLNRNKTAAGLLAQIQAERWAIADWADAMHWQPYADLSPLLAGHETAPQPPDYDAISDGAVVRPTAG